MQHFHGDPSTSPTPIKKAYLENQAELSNADQLLLQTCQLHGMPSQRLWLAETAAALGRNKADFD
jgi:hypothetical protein